MKVERLWSNNRLKLNILLVLGIAWSFDLEDLGGRFSFRYWVFELCICMPDLESDSGYQNDQIP